MFFFANFYQDNTTYTKSSLSRVKIFYGENIRLFLLIVICDILYFLAATHEEGFWRRIRLHRWT